MGEVLGEMPSDTHQGWSPVVEPGHLATWSDPDPAARLERAADPEAELQLIMLLTSDLDPRVQEAAAAHPSHTSVSLLALCGHSDAYVRQTVARHPRADLQVLQQLSGDADPEVAMVAQQRLEDVALLQGFRAEEPTWPADSAPALLLGTAGPSVDRQIEGGASAGEEQYRALHDGLRRLRVRMGGPAIRSAGESRAPDPRGVPDHRRRQAGTPAEPHAEGVVRPGARDTSGGDQDDARPPGSHPSPAADGERGDDAVHAFDLLAPTTAEPLALGEAQRGDGLARAATDDTAIDDVIGWLAPVPPPPERIPPGPYVGGSP